ncbi:MAG: metal-dependent hydrolase [Candidatus Undinarchaeales archaeon]
MPGWKVHLGFGATAGLAAFILFSEKTGIGLNFNPKALIIFISIVIIGSLFPDLDIRNSKIFGVFFGAATITIIISFVRGYLYLGITTTLVLAAFSYMQHRGILHSIAVLLVTALIVYTATLNSVYAFIWIICYFSHLLLDRELRLI